MQFFCTTHNSQLTTHNFTLNIHSSSPLLFTTPYIFMAPSTLLSINPPKLIKFNDTELIPGLPNDIALECLLRLPFTSHPSLKLVSTSWYSTLSHPSFFSLRRLSNTAQNLVFLTQPLSPPPHPSPQISTKHAPPQQHSDETSSLPLNYKLNVFNLEAREWRSLSSFEFVVPAFAQCVSLTRSAKLVVLGGWNPATLDPSTHVVVVDLAAGVWREGRPMPTARSFFAAVGDGGDVYVSGGHDGRKNALKTAEVYDVEADEWRKLPEMAEERDECRGIVMKDDGNNSTAKFWVISGYGTESQGRFRSDAEFYDTKTNTWTKVDGVWPFAGDSPNSSTVVVAGDSPRWLSIVKGELKEFDFGELLWKTVKIGSIPRSVGLSSSVSMVDLGGGKVMVMGNGGGGRECEVEGCGGEGVFVAVESSKKGEIEWNWEHVHAPSNFLGFPFSTSHLFI